MSDLKLGISHQPQESSLGDTTATGAGLQLVAVLDQLHDHQAVYLDYLQLHNSLGEAGISPYPTHLNTRVILCVLTRVTARVRHL